MDSSFFAITIKLFDGLQELVQDNASDYGYTEHVESSDSEPEILSLHRDSDTDTPDLGCDLRIWSSNSTTQASLNELLGIIRRHGHQLPPKPLNVSRVSLGSRRSHTPQRGVGIGSG